MKTKEEVLQNCRVEGIVVKLPEGQLDRKLYQDVAKSLELIGGKWKGGKIYGFVFDSDPTDLLEQIANGEKRNLKKEFQFFETPSNIAKLLVEYANLQKGNEILEPSAGRGAIVKEINAKGFIPYVYELMTQNVDYLQNSTLEFELCGEDFLAVENSIMYNKIIANPPFSNNQDIDHFLKMYDLLVQGGRIVCIMSNSWVNGEQKKQIEFREFLKENKAEIKDLPAGSFKESGTMVSAKIVILDKPINKMKATIINKPNPNNPQIIILPELRELIRPLSQKEFDQLEENIIAEGIRDMLILWKRGEEHILIDGHNRFEISKKHGLDFRFLEREFADIDAVKEWMITNQLGKRNLTENEISYLRGLQYRQMKNTHGGDRKTETSKAHNEPLNETGLDGFKNIKPNTTASKLAETHKVSEATIKRDEEYADALDKIASTNPELRNKILTKDVNISKKELKQIAELPQEEIKQVAKGLEENKPLKDLLPSQIENALEKLAGKHTDFGQIVEKETPKFQEIAENPEVSQSKWEVGQYKCSDEYVDYYMTVGQDIEGYMSAIYIQHFKNLNFSIKELQGDEFPHVAHYKQISRKEFERIHETATIKLCRIQPESQAVITIANLRKEIEDLKASLQIKESSQKIQDNAYTDFKSTRPKYFVHNLRALSCKNKLQEKLNKTLRSYSSILITNKEKFIDELKSKVEEANKEFSRCKPEQVTSNDCGWDKSKDEGFGVQIGETFDFSVSIINYAE